MRNDSFFLRLAVFSAAALLQVLGSGAQNASPYWSLAGNSNATTSSKLGTTNAIPLRLFTNNATRVYINTSGNVGIGNSSPAQKLHVSGNTYISGSLGIGITTPATKLEVVRSDGNYLFAKFRNAATTGDRTTLIDIQNGDGVLWRYGVGGTGNGLGLTAGQFYIERGGAGSFFNISNTGNVGIGTTNPSAYRLKVRHGAYGVDIENASANNNWELYTENSTSSPLDLYYNGVFKGSFDPSSGAYTAASDERLKTNVKEMPSVLARVNQMKPATYNFKNGNNANAAIGKAEFYGFLAQDVMKLFPHLVLHNIDKARGTDVYSLDYSGLSVIAIKAIQELQVVIKGQQQEVDQMEERITAQQQQIDELMAAVRALRSGSANVSLSGATLSQVSPNPVRGSAKISFSLPEGSGRAQLLISDALGRQVKSIPLTAASGVINIDAASLKSGVYNYSLIVDNKTMETKKMTVVQ